MMCVIYVPVIVDIMITWFTLVVLVTKRKSSGMTPHRSLRLPTFPKYLQGQFFKVLST